VAEIAPFATGAVRASPASFLSWPRTRFLSIPELKVVLHVDGGARGNPGPAAIGVVISTSDGQVVDELGETIGVATNNVAEYRGLLRGLERARELGATEVEIVNDSELVARQLTGAYKVKHPAMKPLHAEAMAALTAFDGWSVRSVPRAENARADELVNAALDGEI
jgi:ribonuclease HI